MNDSINDLIVSILVRAVDDYKYTLKTGKEHKHSSLFELERFFRSEWCKTLLEFIDIPYINFLTYLEKTKERLCK